MEDPSRATGHARALRHVSTASHFIGRDEELSQLDQFFQGIIQRQPHLVLINGEAGIGKTRFLTEVQALASKRRLQVLIGRCHEDLALPYLPFIDSLFASLEQELTLLDRDVALIHRLCYGSIASPPVTLPSPEGADQEKLQLFLAISRATLKLAQRDPLLLIVDDLHWADQPSLDLFAYLVYTIANADTLPVCLLATHRPPESGTQLYRLIDRFEREPIYRSMDLPGLDEADTREFLKHLGVDRPSHQLLTMIHQATQGNPFFTQEIVYHLVQNHLLEEQGGYSIANATITTLSLPKRATDALASRLKALNDKPRHLLTLAAFLGDEFSLERLLLVSKVEEDELIDMLEEALNHGLLRETARGFQFAHSLIRQVFYNASSAVRRHHLHLQIAQTLEPLHPEGINSHCLELAHHFVEAGPLVKASTRMDYARKAADHAYARYAWNDAARYYEIALAAAELSNLPSQSKADLYYQAGLAHRRNIDIGPTLNCLSKAVECYRIAGDQRGLAQALTMYTGLQFTLDSIPLGTLADLQPLQDVLESLGDHEPKLRGHIAATIAQAYRHARQPAVAQRMAENALRIGHDIDDDLLCAEAGFSLGLALLSQMRIQEAAETWQTALSHARQAEDPVFQTLPLIRIPNSLILTGQLDKAEITALQGCDLTTTTQDWGEHSLALSYLANISAARGQVELTKQRTQSTMRMAYRSRYPWGSVRALQAMACSHAWRGEKDEAEAALNLLLESGNNFAAPGVLFQNFVSLYRQLIQAYLEMPLEDPIEPLANELIELTTYDTYSLAPLCALIELGYFTLNQAITEIPYNMLCHVMAQGGRFSIGWVFLIPRVLGLAATLAHRWDRAEAHFLRAIEIATESGAQPELGRTYLDYACMLAAQKTRHHQNQAIELAERASDIFQALSMSPFIDRTTRLLNQWQRYLPVRIPATAIDTISFGQHITELSRGMTQTYTKFLG